MLANILIGLLIYIVWIIFILVCGSIILAVEEALTGYPFTWINDSFYDDDTCDDLIDDLPKSAHTALAIFLHHQYCHLHQSRAILPISRHYYHYRHRHHNHRPANCLCCSLAPYYLT